MDFFTLISSNLLPEEISGPVGNGEISVLQYRSLACRRRILEATKMEENAETKWTRKEKGCNYFGAPGKDCFRFLAFADLHKRDLHAIQKTFVLLLMRRRSEFQRCYFLLK